MNRRAFFRSIAVLVAGAAVPLKALASKPTVGDVEWYVGLEDFGWQTAVACKLGTVRHAATMCSRKQNKICEGQVAILKATLEAWLRTKGHIA